MKKACLFIEQEGGPLHKHSYRAWWSGEYELSIEPFIAFGTSVGGRIYREPAVLSIPKPADDSVIELQLSDSTSRTNAKRALLIIAGVMLLVAAQNQQWQAAVAAIVVAAAGFYAGNGIGKSTHAIIKYDLERSFHLCPA